MEKTWGRRLAPLAVVGLAAALSLGSGRCEKFGAGSPGFHFTQPAFGQLSLVGSQDFELSIAPKADPATLQVWLNGDLVPSDDFELVEGGVAGRLPEVGEGAQVLRARVEVPSGAGSRFLEAQTVFETVDLENPDECEILNNVECLLPFPSSRFLEDVGDASETGWELEIPAVGMPVLIGPPLSPEPLNGFDGFSPTVQILMHFPSGVDLEGSGAPRLLEARCCGQRDATPYRRVRTIDDTSLRRESPTALLDVDTGQLIAHFLELDARADGQSERRVLFLRPAESLVPGHRYIVAARRLLDPDGLPVPPEPVFEALRDGTPSTIDALEARREPFEEIFWQLQRAGIKRRDLVLAFDFVVRSDHQLTSQMLSLRDQALHFMDTRFFIAGLDDEFNNDPANFHPHCAEQGEPIWRHVRGSFRSPYFLDGPIGDGLGGVFLGAPRVQLDASGEPELAGATFVKFDILIPCSALDEDVVHRPLLLGHGLLGEGADIVNAIKGLAEQADQNGLGRFDYIAGATDYRGLSRPDFEWIGAQVLGGFLGPNHRLNNFPSFVDRLKQGMVNTLTLAHAMKRGWFNFLEPFQRVPGDVSSGVFPGPDEEEYYYGASLGGIMGLWLGALTPDIERMGIDIGAINFSLLLQRSTQFSLFEDALANVGLDDPMDAALGLGLLHEMWVTSEPAGYARHVTGLVEPPLPGATPKKLLMTVAWLDKQVSNQASEIAARTLGIPNFEGSLVRKLLGIRDVKANRGTGGPDSAYLVYDTGAFDVFDPRFDDVIPPLANVIPSPVCDPHGERPTIPASLQQLLAFLQPDGKLENACLDDGVCNASEPFERPGGREEVCDPLPAP
ncbi:MAG: hypothetical protein V3U03_04020 [Myxococcota bacterium]